MKKQIDLVIISYSTSKAITVIACDSWTLAEDATSPAYSTFTFDKSKINQENFNLIQSDDLIYIKPSDLTGTPFATTTIQGVSIDGGFLQQIETITEDEEQIIIKTKSMTFIPQQIRFRRKRLHSQGNLQPDYAVLACLVRFQIWQCRLYQVTSLHLQNRWWNTANNPIRTDSV